MFKEKAYILVKNKWQIHWRISAKVLTHRNVCMDDMIVVLKTVDLHQKTQVSVLTRSAPVGSDLRHLTQLHAGVSGFISG